MLVLQELAALNAEHKGFVFAYASVEASSCNIENQLRQVSSFYGTCSERFCSEVQQ